MNRRNFFAWFETNRRDSENFRSYYFREPAEVIELTRKEDAGKFFRKLDKLGEKYFLAGFFSYELGYLFEDVFDFKKKSMFPYALFCAYEKAAVFDHRKKRFVSGSFLFPRGKNAYRVKNLRLNITEKKYVKNINVIKKHIYDGDIYQANYTIKCKFDFAGSPLGLYLDLKRKQRVPYGVFARFGDYYILSLSPELFFTRKGRALTVKPMKGTVSRGRIESEDRKNFCFLPADAKNRSENVMIVDLLRNDIGRISIPGSVRVRKLFEVEKYDTLFQMTSTIESVLKKNIRSSELIKSIFPSGSVTGAPKIESMKIIKKLEKEERGVYTGALGFFEPGGNAKFNVAIRTVLIHKGKGEMGTGGGIVYDSSAADEFRECKLKASFLTQKPVSFGLIETILFDGNFKHLDLHMKRMKNSAGYFDFKFDGKKLQSRLKALKTKLGNAGHRVRVLLDEAGGFKITSAARDDAEKEYRVRLSDKRTDSRNIFLFHKTTNRSLYAAELAKARRDGFFDVLFLNEKEEITEGSITNVYIRKRGRLYTPPVESGLLPGIMRRVLMKKYKIREKIIGLNEFFSADAVYVSNSIIGWKKVAVPGGIR
ncbi:MAG: aminodeoxychorismate synthase component I [bacterium]